MDKVLFEDSVDASDEIDASLESYDAEIRELIQSKRWNRHDTSTLHQRLQGLGMEGVSLEARSVWDVIRATARATMGAFGSLFESVAVWWDKTGSREVMRLRRQLAEKTGEEGAGFIVSTRLARRLSVAKVAPRNFQHSTTDLVNFARHVTDHAVPKISQLNRECYAIITPTSSGEDAMHFHKDIMKMVELVAKAGRPEDNFTSQQLMELFPGDRTIFQVVNARAAAPPHPKIHDEASLKVKEYIDSIKHKLLTDGHKGRSNPVNNRLPVLTKAECSALLVNCEQLSSAIRRIMDLSKLYKRDWGSHHVANLIDVTADVVNGEVYVDKETNTAWDTSVPLDGDDLARAEWLSRYFRSSLADHRKILKQTVKVMIAVFESYTDYIHASLKYHR